jgi:transcription elongation factor GreA
MTPEGYKKLQDELKRIRSVERPKNIEDIERARAHGDLSENAEYDAAKEKQGQLDMRMKEIEDKLARAEVIDPTNMTGDRVVFGAIVSITNLDDDQQATYQLVGEDEADRSNGKISIRAPLARGMIGKSVGDMFFVKTPAGEKEYVIDDIRFQ